MTKAGIEVDAREHPIESATVYKSGHATVQRRLSLNVEAGQNSVSIKYLSSVLDAQSIHVGAEATSYSQALTVSDVAYMYSPTIYAPKPNTPEILALEDEKAALGVRIKAVDRQHALLKGHSNSLRAGRVENATTEGLVSFMEMSVEKDAELWEEKKKLEKEIKSLAEKIDEMSAVEEVVPPMLQSGVTLVLQAKEAGPIELVLSYVVTGASWSSAYDIRTTLYDEEDLKKSARISDPIVNLHYRASIMQSTGEDWKDVALTLSTASPVLNTDAPHAEPWRVTASQPSKTPCRGRGRSRELPTAPYIHHYSPSRRSRRSRTPSPARYHYRSRSNDSRNSWSAPEYHQPPVCIAGGIPPPMPLPYVGGTPYMGMPGIPGICIPAPLPVPTWFGGSTNRHVDDGTNSSTFVIHEPSDVPSDGRNHKVSIVNLEFAAELESVAVPRSSTTAFLHCRIKNESSYTLIGGPSAVFVDGTFIANSSMPNVSPSGFFTCFLGPDPSVHITFHPESKVSTTISKKGLLSPFSRSSSRKIVTAYKQRITVKNTHMGTIIPRLIVQDSVAVSQDAKVKVTLSQPNGDALGPVTCVEPSPGVKEPVLEDRISRNVIARWAQKDEKGSGRGGARGDGVLEWVITDLEDSVDLFLALEVTCPADTNLVDM
ncbi:hypothetical protein DL93DRAFT_2166000 [Clavulina sp. PMI_390]|nr:hypothetical protein DL93DRAFT_2166000 [Clavulina sp. PMI_390]